MALFEDLKEEIESTSNSNFHFDKLDWPTQVWIETLCRILDKQHDHMVVFSTRSEAAEFMSEHIK